MSPTFVCRGAWKIFAKNLIVPPDHAESFTNIQKIIITA